MPNNIYIGARYVPIFDGDWSQIKSYEPLTIVQYGNNSYTSRKPVPAGTLPTDTNYWAPTGNYNGQISHLQSQIDDIKDDIDDIKDDIENMASVKMFGAVGDGVTNDSQAFIDCMEAYDVIIVPSGDYVISDVVNVSNKVIIGENSTLIHGNNTTSLTFTKSEVHNVKIKPNKNIVTSNSKFVNSSFDAGNISNAHTTMLFACAENTNNEFERCEFYGATNATFGIWDNYDNNGGSLYVSRCVFSEFYLNAIFASTSKIEIDGCTFWHNHLQTSPNFGGEIDIIHRTNHSQPTLARITNNLFLAPQANSTCHIETELDAATNAVMLTIENNSFTGSDNPLSFGGETFANLKGNRFYNCVNAVYSLDGTAKYTSIGNYFNAVTTRYNPATCCVFNEELN